MYATQEDGRQITQIEYPVGIVVQSRTESEPEPKTETILTQRMIDCIDGLRPFRYSVMVYSSKRETRINRSFFDRIVTWLFSK